MYRLELVKTQRGEIELGRMIKEVGPIAPVAFKWGNLQEFDDALQEKFNGINNEILEKVLEWNTFGHQLVTGDNRHSPSHYLISILRYRREL